LFRVTYNPPETERAESGGRSGVTVTVSLVTATP